MMASNGTKAPRGGFTKVLLCTVLPLWLTLLGCGGTLADEVTPGAESLATSRAAVEMPPDDNSCHESSYTYTTTEDGRRTLRTLHVYNLAASCVSCREYNRCVVTSTWRTSLVCMGPTIEGAVWETYKEGESWSCGSEVYNDCPTNFPC